MYESLLRIECQPLTQVVTCETRDLILACIKINNLVKIKYYNVISGGTGLCHVLAARKTQLANRFPLTQL